jgi:hypothetical protein
LRWLRDWVAADATGVDAAHVEAVDVEAACVEVASVKAASVEAAPWSGWRRLGQVQRWPGAAVGWRRLGTAGSMGRWVGAGVGAVACHVSCGDWRAGVACVCVRGRRQCCRRRGKVVSTGAGRGRTKPHTYRLAYPLCSERGRGLGQSGSGVKRGGLWMSEG